ncbi:MAG: hypothetical protein M5U12_03015 [Verrucomicrobia bacterium]|nr:hypothetical protein [Verrucomicrobiota bacterium]
MGEVGAQAGDDAQEGGLAAAGRTDHGDEFAEVGEVVDNEGNVLDGYLRVRRFAEGLGHALEGDEFRQLGRGGVAGCGRGGRGRRRLSVRGAEASMTHFCFV